MPSDKKRINLTIPDELYVRLQAYKNEQGISASSRETPCVVCL